MGCPDAVSDEIKRIPGIIRVEFDPETRRFHVEFHKRFVTPENILAAVWQAGRKMGKEYLPRILD
uniref:Heavy-metal-associated domain-containing protein n=1 Tax=Desulfobacca acetoxidans TaxID=60893 RepID=A0A7C3ZCL8_9BACT